jgi:hypothetical protein
MESTNSIFAEQKHQQDRQDETSIQITFEHILFVVALGAILLVRLSNLHYNTLFLDEAINGVIGEDYLARVFDRGAMSFHFGSYLYPAVSGTLTALGGVMALRVGAAVTTTAASIFIYLTTRQIFEERAALFAMILFGLSGASISLGQLAVYDTLAVPFLALSLYLIVRAAWETEQQPYYLLGSSAAMVGAALSKYIGLIYIPAIAGTGFVFFLLRGRTFRHTIKEMLLYWLWPAGIVLASYGLFHFRDLIQVATGQGYTAAPAVEIIAVILQEIAPVAALAMAGVCLILLYLLGLPMAVPPALALDQQRLSRKRKIVLRGGMMVILCGLVVLYLAGPLYHVLGGNIRSLWKNVLYSLIFLAPLGGHFLAWLIRQGEKVKEPAARFVGLLTLSALMVLFVNHSLSLHEAHRMGWPNVENVITYLQQAGLDENSRVVAEAMDVFEYYFDFGTDDRLIWSSLWYAYYEEPADVGEEPKLIKGPEAVELGIRNRYYDFVILDDYYAPGSRQTLTPVLTEAGYEVTFSEEQTMPDGSTVLLQVFEPGDRE